MPKRAGKRRSLRRARTQKRWVSSVKTVATYSPEKLFTSDARTIARVLASPRVSPKGIGSGIRMLQFFINRGGKGLSRARRRELEHAKRLLQARLEKDRRSLARGARRLTRHQASC